MTQLVSRQVALAKVEATYGVDAAPTATANAFLVSNLSINEDFKMNPRVAIKKTLAPLQEVPGTYMVQMSFDVELKGSGTAGTAPEYDALLQACGLTPTVVASTSVTYAPTSTGYKSVTIWVYQDGSLFKATGCIGTYTIDAKAGGIPTIKFTFQGHFESHTDTALPSTVDYSTVVPPTVMNAAIAIGAYSPVAQSFTFNSGCKVETPESIGATDGYAPFIISTRDAKGTCDVEMDLVGNFDYYNAYGVGTNYAFTLPIGATAGNIITINMPNFYITGIKQASTNGILTFNLSYAAHESGSATDDEVSVVFT